MRTTKRAASGAPVKKCFAKEKRSFDEILEGLQAKRHVAEKMISRLGILKPSCPNIVILEVGAAQGEFLIASRELGYRCVGLEPVDMARHNAKRLSDYMGITIEMAGGVVEAVPFKADSFDFVIAMSVIEHVNDVEKAFVEVYRVLKPGGVFVFNAASAMCPKQAEISGFPFFGWYPNPLKLKIMNWAKLNRPELVGYTDTPAINWFTPAKGRRLLFEHGFRKVFDRWDILAEDSNMGRYNLPLRVVRRSKFLKYVADVVFTGCLYAAVK